MARFKVCYCFTPELTKAKAGLKKIPKLFSRPHLIQFADGSYGVVAGEYDRKDWAESAVHKLYENKLYGGILSQEDCANIAKDLI